MKSVILGMIALTSLTAFAQDCNYQINATRIASGELVDLCVEAKVDRRSYETVVESAKGSGGASKRRPIFASEARGGFLSSKYIFSNGTDTERALCQLVGEKNTVIGASLVNYGRNEEMVSFNSTKRRWEITPAKKFYLSITTCK